MDVVSDVIKKVQAQQGDTATAENRQAYNEILRELVVDSGDIVGVMLTSSDGLSIGEVLPAGFDGKRFAAMSSALMALSDTLAKEAKKGETLNVMIEGMEGNIYVMHAGEAMTLTVFTNIKPNLGLTLAQAKRTADKILLKSRDVAQQINDVNSK